MTAQAVGSRPAAPEEIENWVVANWRALGLPVQSPTSDFFAIGGTSLAAARFVAGVEEVFGEDALPPEDLYDNPTVQGVAEVIGKHLAATGPGAA